ncbi:MULTISPECIES: 16S rRNA (adenine(1518)-N(6)/adenine(1519)-N(6))-dimethyltransferase RsmA [unclassified Acidiphilium]|jgi:16S rRNA (adenine1518-N6/adenine1519-N6)-dimethyltransferase|uniref:16S rRNA (adenine(1518)-N(6)/adenine(1519)-N(6))- dimethyltransferase RsmA n=1 Tax=unclassified Acidiphilium TaxID=2617493 RepID=UPI000BCF847F|nr:MULTISPECIES: 16S rRNA (adenine(1518)-N(6)/adenine(1519)-N(6))-dimethyltransferase RsmA [unclassified Acidiphilium]OYV55759.1 MAG: 16S rRNA (adenine(1518)-N(6)/adenine(1519)-N(6))-dimethyltransferase [Acidiphilium sp. 20-67-58]HQT60251.1 16S rRNA (adenine(1518)-N(6)/adenine(1519)-N(6))-dimethyltransferase RsmA [Acidiphilium sp.]
MSEMPPLRDVIARHGLSAKRALGQHFLLDPDLLARIARLAGPLDGVNVIEVGPGPGGLTRALLASGAASVTAIELDPRAVGAVTELVTAYPGRLRIIQGDALDIDLAAEVPGPRAIVANLPYNAGTAMLLRWLHQAAEFRSMTLMFQREVAERIVAAPGSAAYGRLAVLAALTVRGAIVLTLPPGAFSPPPKVDSAIVRLVPHEDQLPAALLARVERVSAAAFGQRRKMLRGSLKALGGAALAESVGIDPSRRAETLTPEDFLALARHMPG